MKKMQDMQVFNNSEFGDVRVLEINNEPWFVGKDVATILGYANPSKAVSTKVDSEDKVFRMVDIADSQNGNLTQGQTKTAFINESGLYSLILSSKLPQAKKFKKWVTSEVLPTIRKHGAYMSMEVIEKTLTDPNFIFNLAKQLKEEHELRLAAEQQIERDKPKVMFATALEETDNSCLVGQLARILKQNGIDIGQNRLFSWLRANGYLCEQKGELWNMPTQYSMNLGLMEVKKFVRPYTEIETVTPKITQKGQQYFVQKFLSDVLG